MAARMTPVELNDFVNKLAMEADKIDGYLMEVAVYGNGVITYSEMLQMPIRKIKMFEEKISEKLKQESGKQGTEYL